MPGHGERLRLPHIGLRLHGAKTARDCVELAVAAEKSGFSTLWFAENAFGRGILPAAAACAYATNRIRIGAGVFNPFSRHPTMMAMEICALDEFSNGRSLLGIGAGIGSAVQKMGFGAEKPVPALRDTLAILRPLLRGEQVSYQGTAFSALGVKLDYPTRGDLPILVAGRGELTVKVSGDTADGLIVSNMCSLEFARQSAKRVNGNWQLANRAGVASVVQYMPCAIHKNREDAQIMGKRTVGEMLPGFWSLAQKVASAKEALLAGTGIVEEEFAEGARRIKAGEDAADVLDERFTRAFSLTGTPEDCVERAADYADAGVTELALTFDGVSAPDDIVTLGEVLRRDARYRIVPRPSQSMQ